MLTCLSLTLGLFSHWTLCVWPLLQSQSQSFLFSKFPFDPFLLFFMINKFANQMRVKLRAYPAAPSLIPSSDHHTYSVGFHAKYSVWRLSWWNSSRDGITGAASKGVCCVTKVKWRWLQAAWRPWFSVPCAAAFPPCSWDKAFTVWKWWRHLISLWQLSVTWSAKTSTPGLSTVVMPQDKEKDFNNRVVTKKTGRFRSPLEVSELVQPGSRVTTIDLKDVYFQHALSFNGFVVEVLKLLRVFFYLDNLILHFRRAEEQPPPPPVGRGTGVVHRFTQPPGHLQPRQIDQWWYWSWGRHWGSSQQLAKWFASLHFGSGQIHFCRHHQYFLVGTLIGQMA